MIFQLNAAFLLTLDAALRLPSPPQAKSNYFVSLQICPKMGRTNRGEVRGEGASTALCGISNLLLWPLFPEPRGWVGGGGGSGSGARLISANEWSRNTTGMFSKILAIRFDSTEKYINQITVTAVIKSRISTP